MNKYRTSKSEENGGNASFDFDGRYLENQQIQESSGPLFDGTFFPESSKVQITEDGISVCHHWQCTFLYQTPYWLIFLDER